MRLAQLLNSTRGPHLLTKVAALGIIYIEEEERRTKEIKILRHWI